MSFMNMFGNRGNKTFKTKRFPIDGGREELLRRTTATLGSGNLRDAVKLPEGEDPNEWIAVNIVDFFNQTTMLYGTITEFCTNEHCPKMSAGAKYEYKWAETQNQKKVISCTAPQYVDYLMSWVQEQLDDEAIFPSKIGVPFPRNFLDVARTIMKRLFRIYAHIYYEHFEHVEQLKEEAHLNTSFKHFVLFVQEFDLVEPKELAPLRELIDKMTSLTAHEPSKSVAEVVNGAALPPR